MPNGCELLHPTSTRGGVHEDESVESVLPLMGRVGSAYDNAMMESFFGTLQRELLDRRQ